jgi:hypothetical protein
LGADTKPRRLGVEMNPLIDDTYPDVPSPLMVEANCVSKKDVLTKFNKLGLETKLNKLGVETKLNKLGVETKLNKFGVEINPLKDDK